MKIIQYPDERYTSFEIPLQDGVFAFEWNKNFDVFDGGIYDVDVKEPSLIKDATLDQLHSILTAIFRCKKISFWDRTKTKILASK
jgi:hypothetical protein